MGRVDGAITCRRGWTHRLWSMSGCPKQLQLAVCQALTCKPSQLPHNQRAVRRDAVYNFQQLDPQHLAVLPERYTHGFSFNNITCEGRCGDLNVVGGLLKGRELEPCFWADIVSGPARMLGRTNASPLSHATASLFPKLHAGTTFNT